MTGLKDAAANGNARVNKRPTEVGITFPNQRDFGWDKLVRSAVKA